MTGKPGRPRKEPEKTAIELDVEQWMASLGSEPTAVKLLRVEGGNQVSLAQFSPHELIENGEGVIGRKFGPGRYLLRALVPDADGRRRLGPGKMLILAPDSDYVGEWQRENNAPMVTGPNGMDPMISIQLKMMEMSASAAREQAQQMHELVLAMVNQGGRGGGSNMAELITAVQALKEMSGGVSKITEMKELVEMASILGGGGGKEPETPWTTLSKLATLMVEGKTEPRALPPAPAAAGSIASLPNPAQSSPKAASEHPLFDALLDKAKRGRDPELWADNVLEMADDEGNGEAIVLIDAIDQSEDETAWASKLPVDITKIDAEIRDWLVSFFKRVKDNLKLAAPVAAEEKDTHDP